MSYELNHTQANNVAYQGRCYMACRAVAMEILSFDPAQMPQNKKDWAAKALHETLGIRGRALALLILDDEAILEANNLGTDQQIKDRVVDILGVLVELG